jgi:hypothetical protein
MLLSFLGSPKPLGALVQITLKIAVLAFSLINKLFTISGGVLVTKPKRTLATPEIAAIKGH